MCLSCEYYVDNCEVPACIEAAHPYNRFQMRSGKTIYLWRGTDEPCEHIKVTTLDWEEYLEE